MLLQISYELGDASSGDESRMCEELERAGWSPTSDGKHEKEFPEDTFDRRPSFLPSPVHDDVQDCAKAANVKMANLTVFRAT